MGERLQISPAPLSREKPKSIEKASIINEWAFLGSAASWERQFHKGFRKRIIQVEPLREDQLHIALFGTMGTDERDWRKEAEKELKGRIPITFFDPTIEGRSWQPSDGIRETEEMRNAAFPIVAIEPEKLGAGAGMEVALIAMSAFLQDRYFTGWVRDINENVVDPKLLAAAQRARDLQRINLDFLRQLTENGKVLTVSNLEDACPQLEEVITETRERTKRSVRDTRTKEFVANTEAFPIAQKVNIHGASKDIHKLDTTVSFLKNEGIEYTNWIVDLSAEEWSKNDYQLYKDEMKDRIGSSINFTYCDPTSLASMADIGFDSILGALRGTHSIIYLPEISPENDPEGTYRRTRNLYKGELAMWVDALPWMADYIRVTDSLDEAHQYMRTICKFSPEANLKKPAETTFDLRKPEKFTREDIMYTPNRITQERVRTPEGIVVRDSKRIQDFQVLLEEITYESPQKLQQKVDEHTVRQRLYDLVIANAAGRIFPIPNSAADVIPVATGWTEEQIQRIEAQGYNSDNCIVVGIGKKDKKLRVIGGFNDFGEELAFSGKREIKEEIGGEAKNFVPFASFSRPTRDERFPVVSGCFAATVDVNGLSGSNEIEQVIIVPLIDQKGKFNRSFTVENTQLTDINGTSFSHQGVRADHKEVLRSLYNYWTDNRKSSQATLREVVEEMSAVFPQELVLGEVNAEEPETTFSLSIADNNGGSSNLRVTKNILFVLQNAAEIFKEAGYPDPIDRAIQFAQKAQAIDLLAPYPQAAVAADVFIIKNDNLVVQEFSKEDGTKEFRLLGTYYAPENNDSGKNFKELIESIAKTKTNLHLSAHAFLGITGSRIAVDPRYPRNTFLFAGSISDDKLPEGVLADGSLLREIPIWNAERSGLSTQLTQAQWGFGHKDLLQFLQRSLQQLDPTHEESVQEIYDSRRLSSSSS